jgi:site-specific recombinase XerD
MSHLYPRGKIFWLAYHRGGRLYRESLKTKDRTTAKYLQAKHDQGSAEGRAPILNAEILSVLEEYRIAYEHHKTHRTHIEDQARIKHFITWSKIHKISDVREKTLQDYFNYRINTDTKDYQKLGPNTINRIMASIKTFLNFAVRRHYLPENPIRSIKRYRLPVNPPRFLNKDEITEVLKKAKKTDLYPCVATATYTGMRRAELFSLEWLDIDFEKDVITVSNKEGFTTKSKRFRSIPLHPTLKSILGPYRLKEGRCFDQTNQRRTFRRIMRQAKLKDIGWHSLRHTFASQLVMAGVDIVTVSKLLGHSNIATTMIYSHLTGDHIRGAIGKLRF